MGAAAVQNSMFFRENPTPNNLDFDQISPEGKKLRPWKSRRDLQTDDQLPSGNLT